MKTVVAVVCQDVQLLGGTLVDSRSAADQRFKVSRHVQIRKERDHAMTPA